MTEEEVYLQSEETHEYLSKVPEWFYQWGQMAIAILVVFGFGLAFFIQYPDKIKGPVNITSVNQPVKLVSQTQGKIILLKTNNADVNAGEPVAYIQSDVSFEVIRELKTYLATTEKQLYERRITEIKEPNGENLAYFTIESINFNEAVIKLKRMLSDPSYATQLNFYKKAITSNKTLETLDKYRFDIIQETNQQARQKYTMIEELYKSGTISKAEYIRESEEYFSKVQKIIDAQQSKETRTQAIDNLQKEYTQTQQGRSKTLSDAIDNVKVTKDKLKNAIQAWEKANVFYATKSGKLNYLVNIFNNKYIANNQELFAIIPVDNQYFAIAKMPTQDFGKIKKGQIVRINLNNYAASQYGFIEGKVEDWTRIPIDNQYDVIVSLPNGLNTTSKRRIYPMPEMPGTAEVVVEKRSIFKKLFDKVKASTY